MANIFIEQIPVGMVVDPEREINALRQQVADLRQRNEALLAAAVRSINLSANPPVVVRPPTQEEDDIATAVGQWVIDKYRAAAKERGYQAVAKQLRKQGVPIEIAKLILLEVQL